MKTIIFIAVLLLMAGCVGQTPETKEPVITVPTTAETTTTVVVTTTTTSTTTTTLPIRSQNQKEYYEYIDAHYSEFEPYLREGNYTEITPDIEVLGNEIWYSNETYTDDPISDYVSNLLLWYPNNTREPLTKFEDDKTLGQVITAQDFLEWGYGYCDERVVLFKSLLLYKGIPSQFKIIMPYTVESGEIIPDYESDMHIYLQVFLEWNGKYRWVDVDPSSKVPRKIKERTHYLLESDVTEEMINHPRVGNLSEW